MTPDQQAESTRKERREQARAERRAREEADKQAATRRKRLMQIGAAVASVVVIIAVIVITTGGGGSKKAPAPKSAAATQQTASVTALLREIPQSGNTLGDPKAPAVLQYFGDLECPYCRQFTLQTLPTIINKYVRTGKLKLEYHSLETATRAPGIFKTQQIAALAAGKQNLMWYYVELFYHEQGEEDSGYVTESYLQGLAQQVPGLNLTRWTSDRNDPELATQVTTDANVASSTGLSGTPSFRIGKNGGSLEKLEASFSEVSGFEAAIEKQLKG